LPFFCENEFFRNLFSDAAGRLKSDAPFRGRELEFDFFNKL